MGAQQNRLAISEMSAFVQKIHLSFCPTFPGQLSRISKPHGPYRLGVSDPVVMPKAISHRI